MNTDQIKTVAATVPRSVDELKSLGTLGDQVVRDYGERLVKVINAFVESNELEDYVNERPSKLAKTTDGAKKPLIVIDDDDEDGTDAVDLTHLPDSKPSTSKGEDKKSRFFN